MSHRRFESSIRRQRGFTLAEILVTTAIFAIIMIAALAVYDQSNKVFKTSTESADMQQSTRIGFDKLVSDLRMAGFDYNRGGQPQETFQATQPDEQIEYAGPTAVVFRANFNYNTAAATDNGRELAYTPRNIEGKDIFPYVTTSNDEIVGYVMRSNNAGANTGSISFWVDDYQPRAAFPATITPAPAPGSPSHPEAQVTIGSIDTTNANPPYTLYRVTVSDILNNRVGTPVAENIRSLNFQYYSDTKGTVLLTNPGGTAITNGRNAGGGTFSAVNTGAIGGAGRYDPANVGTTTNFDDRIQRSLIQAVRVSLVGMNASPDLQGYTNPTETIAAIKNYREYALSSLVVPRNLGKTGFPEPAYNPPGPPTITAVCTGYCGAPVIYWNPPSTGGPVVQYRIEWDTNQNGAFSNFMIVTDPSAVSAVWPDDGATDVAQTRYYRIKAQNDNGLSVASNLFAATPQNSTRPSPVANFTAVGQQNGIVLNWQNPTLNATGMNSLSCGGTPPANGTNGSQMVPQEVWSYQIWRGEEADFDQSNGVKVLDFFAGSQPPRGTPGSTVTWVDSATTSAYPPANCKQYYYRIRIADRCSRNSNWNNPSGTANAISDFLPPLGSPAIPAGGAQGSSTVTPRPPALSLGSGAQDNGCPDPQNGSSQNCRITLVWTKVTADTAGNPIAVDTYRVTRDTRITGSGNAWGLDNNFGNNGQLIVNCSTGTCSSGTYTQQSGNTAKYVDFPPSHNGNGQTLEYDYTVAALGCPGAVSSPNPQPSDPYSAESNQVAYPGCAAQVAVQVTGNTGGSGDTPTDPYILGSNGVVTVASTGGPSIANVRFAVTMWPQGTPLSTTTDSVSPFTLGWTDQTDGQIYMITMTVTDTTSPNPCQQILVKYVMDQIPVACAVDNQLAPSLSLATAGGTVTDSETMSVPVSGTDPITLQAVHITWDVPTGDTTHSDLKFVSMLWTNNNNPNAPVTQTSNVSPVATLASPGPTVTNVTAPNALGAVNPGNLPNGFALTIRFQYRANDDPPSLAASPIKKICIDYTIPSEPGVTKHCNIVGQSSSTANPNACD